MSVRGFSGSPGPVMRQKDRGTRPLRNKMRAAARRKGYVGFPIPARSFTAQEVDDYFSGETITCLLCGRGFRRLGGHLQAIHQVTEDDYRARYGLPWRRGLTGTAAHESYRAATLRRMEAGEMPALCQGLPPGEHARRPRQPFHAEKCKQRDWLGTGMEARFGAAEFDAILGAVASGTPVPHVLGTGDLPSETWFRSWLRRHPEAKARLLATIDAAPFDVQARLGYGMGARFTEAVRELRAQGLSDKRIAELLGVTAMTVHGRRRRAGIK